MEGVAFTIKNLHTYYIEAKVILTIILSIIGFFFGEVYNDAMRALVILMSFDIITGILASKIEGLEISSLRFGKKIIQGGVWVLVISAGYFADLTVPGEFIQFTLIAWVGVNEMVSILENVGRMGYRTPQKLLNQLRQKRDDK